MKLIFASILLLVSVQANAALISRLGGQAVYDTDLDITWLADANLAASNTFGVAGIQPNGSMFGNFVPEMWLDGLNSFGGTGYLGFSGWRFTTNNCDTTAGQNCVDNEFGHLFYNELGGSALSQVSSSGDPDLALFSNIVEDNWYWSGSLSSGHIRVFDFGSGSHSRTFGSLARYNVWAVHDGDIGLSPIPAPPALLLFGTGLLGLIGFTKRRRAA